MQPDQAYGYCVSSLKEYVDKAGFTEVVLGLSGGLDSTLVAVMCVDALGAENVHGVLLPGPYSSAHSIEDATALAENLGIRADVISICEAYEAFERALAKNPDNTLSGISAENTQARCRTVFLMALSNTHGWLMINTGNKSEAMMGYSTLYGDTAGAFAPLGGLYKTDVFSLSRWVNQRAEQAGEIPPIPENVLTKPPSAELSPGQEDEHAMGIDYVTLDAILIARYEQGGSVAEVARKAGVTEGEVERIDAVVRGSAFKRALEPPYPEISYQ